MACPYCESVTLENRTSQEVFWRTEATYPTGLERLPPGSAHDLVIWKGDSLPLTVRRSDGTAYFSGHLTWDELEALNFRVVIRD
jgi:hypothetical protein